MAMVFAGEEDQGQKYDGTNQQDQGPDIAELFHQGKRGFDLRFWFHRQNWRIPGRSFW
jgi:hypothetical protein